MKGILDKPYLKGMVKKYMNMPSLDAYLNRPLSFRRMLEERGLFVAVPESDRRRISLLFSLYGCVDFHDFLKKTVFVVPQQRLDGCARCKYGPKEKCKGDSKLEVDTPHLAYVRKLGITENYYLVFASRRELANFDFHIVYYCMDWVKGK